MVYYSELKNVPVYDSHHIKIGILRDMIFADGEKSAKITHIVYSGDDRTERKLNWSFVEEIRGQKDTKKIGTSIRLNSKKSDLQPFFVKESNLRVSKLLDKQVVDIDGMKVVRINDLLLVKVDGAFSIIAVCIGTLSFFRRLGVVPYSMKNKSKENIIPWRSIEALHKPFRDVHLKVQKQKIADLHPEDIADIMEDLNPKDANLIFNSLNKRKAARTLIELESDTQTNIIKDFKKKRVVDFLEEIPPEQAADILELFPKSRQTEILTMMAAKTSRHIAKILKYPDESAGTIMETEFVAVPEKFSVKQTINYIRNNPPSTEKLYHIYSVDKDKKLTGIIPIRRLLVSSPLKKIKDIKQSEVIYVETETSHDDIAKTMSRYDLFILPVVSPNRKLLGVVTADDILAEVMPQKWRAEKHKARKMKHHEVP
ncbi:magnesium transporter [Nanoarchaeota archaeon]